MSVDRYDLIITNAGNYMEIRSDGDWVEIDEYERLKSLWLSEQKQRLDQFNFVKTYDAAKCKLEIDELKSINAELLAALKYVVKHQECIGGTLGKRSVTWSIAIAAIEKAQPEDTK